jgi:Ni/Fe-hydrogenase 1 B-type cytochrome subunit
MQNKFTIGIRIWHWLTMIAILGAIITVLLRNNALNSKKTGALIQSELKEKGIILNEDDSKDIAKAIRKPIWEWHFYFGFIISGLFLVRIYLFFIKSENLFWQSIKSSSQIIKQKEEWFSSSKFTNKHQWLVHCLYGTFYLFLFSAINTGLLLYFKKELSLSKELSGTIQDIHEMSIWFFCSFICVHLLGIIIAESKYLPGIVSKMIGGRQSTC